jgi:hypothetical protein
LTVPSCANMPWVESSCAKVDGNPKGCADAQMDGLAASALDGSGGGTELESPGPRELFLAPRQTWKKVTRGWPVPRSRLRFSKPLPPHSV